MNMRWLFSWVFSAMLGLASGAVLAQAGNALVSVGGPTFHEADVLPGQTTAEVLVPVSEVTRLQLQVIAPVPNPVITLENPSGAAVSLANATFLDGSLQSPAIPGGSLHTPWIAQPSNGVWKVRVRFAPASARTVILVTVLAESPYKASVVLGGLNFRQGDAAAASLMLLANSSPVTGAAVSLKARAPSGQVIDLSPNDSATPQTADAKANDGLYSGAIVFEEVGQYLFEGVAQFAGAAGVTVSRKAQAVAFVSAPKLALTNIFPSQRSGPNGCVAAVDINLTTRLLVPGQVVSRVVLRASNGRRMERSASLNAAAGALPLIVSFPAGDIPGELGVAGPYTVETVQVVVTSSDGTTLEGSASEAAVTPAFSLASLCVNPVSVGSRATITPQISNGYISALGVSFPISVTAAGSYRVSFRVTGGERQQIVASSQTLLFSVGSNDVTLVVPAASLQSVDGPFQVESVLVQGPSGTTSASLVGSDANYSRWQFAPTIRGDLNADGRVDVLDRDLLARFRNIRGLQPGDRRDLDRNGVIDLRDVQLIQRMYCAAGSCPPP